MSGQLLQSSGLHSNAPCHTLGTFGTDNALTRSVESSFIPIASNAINPDHTNRIRRAFLVGMALLLRHLQYRYRPLDFRPGDDSNC